ncbi:ABC transporter permease subunit [Natrinema salsiterrestre]|uniref:ABC transporter permease n=1 Tax=Natrinema salsiterrestre TaxID=2950540 RepID=A0A9Q4L707_9EURY|nr:ABC transporter permease subunit [Natrinema salsiterrestre]MDF9747110.1 ABC transporter permease [Natrinema salsiterrestre]
MTWTAIARKDFEDVVRSRMVWGITAVFLLLMGIVTLGASSQIDDASATDVIFFFTNIGGQLFVPIIALVVGYMAIVGERQSGSLRILFGLSHNRRDVLVGKLASRTGVIVVATLAACAFAAALMFALFGSLPVPTVLGFVALTVLLGAAFTAIAVGVSAMTDTRMGAMGGAIGSYILFTMLWHPLIAGLHYALEGELVGVEAPAWYLFALRLNPLESYRQAIASMIDAYVPALVGWENIVEDVPAGSFQEGTLLTSNRVAGDVPFYLSEWFAPVVLLAWIVVPIAIGYRRFERADLN